MAERLKRLLLGGPRDIRDPEVFHKISLAAFLAWVGLGADGLSSSAYGPEEAYRALGAHTHLALILVIMTAVTIFVISFAYANLVDYVLTISVSVASACDAMYSFLPPHWAGTKLLAAGLALLLLLVLNLRGVKESVTLLAPIFLFFVFSHAAMILYAVGSHLSGLPEVFRGTYTGIEAVSNGVRG